MACGTQTYSHPHIHVHTRSGYLVLQQNKNTEANTFYTTMLCLSHLAEIKLTFTKSSLIWGAKFCSLFNTAFEQCTVIIVRYIKTCVSQTRQWHLLNS